jgi:uncharacterized membrane protein
MTRWLLWLVAGALLGGIVHLVTVLILPRTASQDAYSRLSPIAPVNAIAAVPAPSPQNAVIPFMDPAFAAAVCRYDLSNGPLKLATPVAINDRAAGRRVIELDLMTTEQRNALQEDEEVTAADRLIVESPTATGLIVVRALAPEPGLMPAVRNGLATAKCQAQ